MVRKGIVAALFLGLFWELILHSPSVSAAKKESTTTTTTTVSTALDLPSFTKASNKKGVGIPAPHDCRAYGTECKNRLFYQVRSLGATWWYCWYLDTSFVADQGTQPLTEYVPYVGWGTAGNYNYSATELSSIKSFATRHPGSYWLVFNEPDFNNQSDPYNSYIPVDDAARVYKQFRDAIRSVDQTAMLIVGGMLYESSWGGWARAFRDSYKRQYPADGFPDVQGWHAHLYKCGSQTSTTDPAYYNSTYWRNAIINFRGWINNIGGGELWLTEWGCLNTNQPQTIIDQLDWMETYSGIQRYAYFSVSSLEWGSRFQGGNLVSGAPWSTNFGLSSIGQTYASYPLNPEPTRIPTATSTPRPTRTPTPTPTLGACPDGNLGNLDCDNSGLINDSDLQVLKDSWSPYGPAVPPAYGQSSADISGPGNVPDNKVDVFDTDKLLTNWRL